MDKKRIILLCAMGLLLAAAIALGVAWVIEANEYAGYEADMWTSRRTCCGRTTILSS